MQQLQFATRAFKQFSENSEKEINNIHMKTNIGLLVGGLVLLLGSTASATTTALTSCGTVSSPNNGTVGFNQSFNGGAGTASVSGMGDGTIVCSGYTVPALQTLTAVTFFVTDDAQASQGTTSQITWTWTYSGESLSPTPGASNSETGNNTNGFNTCVGTGTLSCNILSSFTPTNVYSNGQMTGTFSFNVTPAVTGALGLGNGGGDSAQIQVEFTYVPTASIPEPSSLLLIGSGLIGLGAFARRKRQQ
jgi:hypothetical protein